MPKVDIETLQSLKNDPSAVNTINGNFNRVQEAIENTLSRDGTEPNQLQDVFDANNNRIINLPPPAGDTDPVRWIDVLEMLSGKVEFDFVFATEEEAIEGTSTTAVMSPLRTKQSIASEVGWTIAAKDHTQDVSTIIGLQDLLDGKANLIHNHDDRYFLKSEVTAALAGKADLIHIHANATTSTAGFMSAADKAKLDGLEPGGMTPAEIKVAYESNANTNAFTDAEKSKLAGIAAGATANDTNANLRARSTHTGTQDIVSTTTGTLTIARGGTGQTTEAGMRGVYTGTAVNNTAFPINSTVLALASALVNRNAVVTVRLSGNPAYFEVGGAGAVLAGTWAARGTLTISTSTYLYVQRTN